MTYYDQAATISDVPKSLIETIKKCDSMIEVNFPIHMGVCFSVYFSVYSHPV